MKIEKHTDVVTGWDKDQKIVFLRTFGSSYKEREEMLNIYEIVKNKYPYFAMQTFERWSEMIDSAIEDK